MPYTIEVLEPQDRLLRRYVDSIYIFRKGPGRVEFTAYPSMNLPVGLFRNASVSAGQECVYIKSSDLPNHFAIACNQFSSGIHLRYSQLVDEIAINFKPLGFASFSGSKPSSGKLFSFGTWDEFLPDLFSQVFATDDSNLQLYHIENFLLDRYAPVSDEAILLQALELLNDIGADHTIQDIADITGGHYKHLYRHFKEQIGCSPARYRKLVRFRNSVVSKVTNGNKTRLVDVCYQSGYTDQPYFIRQFKKLTGEKPVRFFKSVVSFGNDKVIFKMG